MASFWIKNRVWNKADDFATSSLLYERCNNSLGRVMRKTPDFSLLYEQCNISLARPMRNYGLWNRNALMECLGNEKGVRIFTEPLRRSYSFILCKWWDIVDILQQPLKLGEEVCQERGGGTLSAARPSRRRWAVAQSRAGQCRRASSRDLENPSRNAPSWWECFFLLNPYRCIIFQLAFLTLRVLLVVQHAHVLVEILWVWEIEVDHIGAALRPNGIVVRILYAPASRIGGKWWARSWSRKSCHRGRYSFRWCFRCRPLLHTESRRGHSVHRGAPWRKASYIAIWAFSDESSVSGVR